MSRGKGAYDSDVQLRLAGEAILHRLGEATVRLPIELADNYPEVPFGLVKGIRNKIVHDYDRADPEIVWTTLQRDIPRFVAQVTALD